MRDREAILGPLGYDVRYRTQSNYNGSRGGDREVCITRKDDSEFFAHVFNDPVKLDRHRRIQTVQDSIPNMARIELIVDRVVLFAKAEGKLLWDYDPPPDIRAVESQLLDFAAATQMNGLIHGDLRPWNVFVDDENRLTVIDWGLASFVDELSTYDLFRWDI